MLDGEDFAYTLIRGFLFWTQIHISQVKVILACLLTTGAATDWTNELSGPTFFDLFGVLSSVDLEDEDLDDIMNNNGQCPVSLSPIS